MRFLYIIFALLILVSCHSKKEAVTDPKAVYNDSVRLIHQKRYDKAIAGLEAIEAEHPESELAPKAQILRAYAHYLDNRVVDVSVITNDFIKHYPSYKYIDYVYYLRAISYYDQIVDIGRDQKNTLETVEMLKAVIAKFPGTAYAKDAMQKLQYSNNMLAGKEMTIGRFYLHQNQTISAVNRFKTVIAQFSDTVFVPEALYRMVEIYYSWGIVEQAKIYASILGHNFRSSIWYHRAYSLLQDGSP